MFKKVFPTLKKIDDVLTKNQKKSIFLLLMMMLLSAITETFGISLIIPYFAVLTDPEATLSGRIGTFIFRVCRISDQNEMLIFLTAALIVAFGIKYLLSYVIRLRQTNFVNKNRLFMAKRIMKFLMQEDYEQYLYRNITEEMNLVTIHVTWTFELINALLSMTIQMLSVLLLSLFMLMVDAKITLIFGIGIGLLYLIFHGIFKNRVKSAGEEANKTWEEYVNTICEAFLLKKENNVFGRDDKVFSLFNYWGLRNVTADEKKIKYEIIPGLITNLISVWAILFFVLGSLFSGNNIVANLGKLSAFYLAVIRIVPGVSSIYSGVQKISFYTPSLDKVYEMLGTLDQNDSESTLNLKPCCLHQSVRMNDVSFRYRNSDCDILEHINLEIKRGEKIGIVGKTGSGKTTLINLVIGLLRPSSGEIYIDNEKMALNSILEVGYVPQDTNLLDSTIRENIVFGRNVSDDDLEKVIRDSGLQDFVSHLPCGLETKIGEQGMRLSGGQRQRIGIARALIGSPAVLIFDESTSSLDLETEHEIIDTIQQLGCDKTVIMISHRPNTLQFCGRWFKVENHQVTEMNVCP